MKTHKFNPTHKVLEKTPGEFTFFKGELLEKLSDNYYKDRAGNIGYVDDSLLEELDKY